MKVMQKMNKKNIIFIACISLVFLLLISNLKYTGFSIYRVPFNIDIDILNTNKEVNAGDNLKVNLVFYNLLEPRSVSFNYSVKSLTGETLITKSESIFIENETVLKKAIIIPKSAETGYYLVSVDWDNTNSKTSSLFKIKSDKKVIKFSIIKVLVSLIIILISILIIIFVLTHNTVLEQLSNLNKAQLSLFFWRIGWSLKQHNYFIKYIAVIIILCLLSIILVLINY